MVFTGSILIYAYTVNSAKGAYHHSCRSQAHQPYNYYNVRSENLELDQLFIPKLVFFFILITSLVDIVLTLSGKILSWSLMGVKGLNNFDLHCLLCPNKFCTRDKVVSNPTAMSNKNLIKLNIIQTIPP